MAYMAMAVLILPAHLPFAVTISMKAVFSFLGQPLESVTSALPSPLFWHRLETPLSVTRGWNHIESYTEYSQLLPLHAVPPPMKRAFLGLGAPMPLYALARPDVFARHSANDRLRSPFGPVLHEPTITCLHGG